jgi:hypothetical protein
MVYLVQDPPPKWVPDGLGGGTRQKLNFGPALKYAGEGGKQVEVLLPTQDFVLSPAPAVAELRKKLRNFGDDDFLLLVGDPIAIGLAVKIAADANRGVVRCLRWMKTEHDYVEVRVDFNPVRPTPANFV